MYESGRTHISFSDKTGLILHPKCDCFTFFHKDGTKVRQLTKYAIGYDGVSEKVKLGLEFVKTFGEYPPANHQTIDDKNVVKMFQKVTRAYWPGQTNLNDYMSRDDQGNFHLASIEGSDICEMVLSQSGFTVRVSYLSLLPNKAAEWVPYLEEKQESFSDIKEIMRVEGMIESTESKRRLKMQYTYQRITSIFSVAQIPENFSYPL